jgi:hypothetical protein
MHQRSQLHWSLAGILLTSPCFCNERQELFTARRLDLGNLFRILAAIVSSLNPPIALSLLSSHV